jgi:small conductance mechanosensitive channel
MADVGSKVAAAAETASSAVESTDAPGIVAEAAKVEKEITDLWDQVRNAFENAFKKLLEGFTPDWKMLPTAIAVLILSWIASVVASYAIARFCKHRLVDETLAKFLCRASKYCIIGFGIIAAMQAMNVPVGTLVAGIGLSGLVLGIAMKDVVSNAVSGVMLLLFRPFRHRDHIKVGDFAGEVVDIDMRYTHLDAGETIVFVPNAMMFSLAVTVKARPKPEPTAAKGKFGITETISKALAAGRLRIDQAVHKTPPPPAKATQPVRARALSALQSDDEQ